MNRTMKKIFVATMAILTVTISSCGKDDNNNGDDTGVTNDEWVDLGLPSGLLWCSHNVGATKPEEYGNYYAWGETAPKNIYSWSTYKYCEMVYSYGIEDHKLTKYCTTSNGPYGYNGFIDNKTTLESSDDAARVNMGIGIRTPTEEEWEELIAHTSIEGMTINGVKGIRFVASNGNSIFLPAAGARENNDFRNYDVWDYYWTSSLYMIPTCAVIFSCYPEAHPEPRIQYENRAYGLSVRAVRSAR